VNEIGYGIITNRSKDKQFLFFHLIVGDIERFFSKILAAINI